MEPTDLYAVVVFIAQHENQEDVVELIPTNWLKGEKKSQWPKFKSETATKAVRDRLDPDPAWPTYKIRIIRSFSKYLK